MRYSVVITPYPELGKYGAYVPALDRWTEGHSVEEALEMARDLIELCVDLAREDGVVLPVETVPPLLTVVTVGDPVNKVA